VKKQPLKIMMSLMMLFAFFFVSGGVTTLSLWWNNRDKDSEAGRVDGLMDISHYNEHALRTVSFNPLFNQRGELNRGVAQRLITLIDEVEFQATSSAHGSTVNMTKVSDGRHFSKEAVGDSGKTTGGFLIKLFDAPDDGSNLDAHQRRMAGQWYQLVYRVATERNEPVSISNDALTVWAVEPYRTSPFQANRAHAAYQSSDLRRTVTSDFDAVLRDAVNAPLDGTLAGIHAANMAQLQSFFMPAGRLPNNWQSQERQSQSLNHIRVYGRTHHITSNTPYRRQAPDESSFSRGASYLYATNGTIATNNGMNSAIQHPQWRDIHSNATAFGDSIFVPSAYEVFIQHEATVYAPGYLTNFVNPDSVTAGGTLERSGLWQLSAFDRSYGTGGTSSNAALNFSSHTYFLRNSALGESAISPGAPLTHVAGARPAHILSTGPGLTDWSRDGISVMTGMSNGGLAQHRWVDDPTDDPFASDRGIAPVASCLVRGNIANDGTINPDLRMTLLNADHSSGVRPAVHLDLNHIRASLEADVANTRPVANVTVARIDAVRPSDRNTIVSRHGDGDNLVGVVGAEGESLLFMDSALLGSVTSAPPMVSKRNFLLDPDYDGLVVSMTSSQAIYYDAKGSWGHSDTRGYVVYTGHAYRSGMHRERFTVNGYDIHTELLGWSGVFPRMCGEVQNPVFGNWRPYTALNPLVGTTPCGIEFQFFGYNRGYRFQFRNLAGRDFLFTNTIEPADFEIHYAPGAHANETAAIAAGDNSLRIPSTFAPPTERVIGWYPVVDGASYMPHHQTVNFTTTAATYTRNGFVQVGWRATDEGLGCTCGGSCFEPLLPTGFKRDMGLGEAATIRHHTLVTLPEPVDTGTGAIFTSTNLSITSITLEPIWMPAHNIELHWRNTAGDRTNDDKELNEFLQAASSQLSTSWAFHSLVPKTMQLPSRAFMNALAKEHGFERTFYGWYTHYNNMTVNGLFVTGTQISATFDNQELNPNTTITFNQTLTRDEKGAFVVYGMWCSGSADMSGTRELRWRNELGAWGGTWVEDEDGRNQYVGYNLSLHTPPPANFGMDLVIDLMFETLHESRRLPSVNQMNQMADHYGRRFLGWSTSLLFEGVEGLVFWEGSHVGLHASMELQRLNPTARLRIVGSGDIVIYGVWENKEQDIGGHRTIEWRNSLTTIDVPYSHAAVETLRYSAAGRSFSAYENSPTRDLLAPWEVDALFPDFDREFLGWVSGNGSIVVENDDFSSSFSASPDNHGHKNGIITIIGQWSDLETDNAGQMDIAWRTEAGRDMAAWAVPFGATDLATANLRSGHYSVLVNSPTRRLPTVQQMDDLRPAGFQRNFLGWVLRQDTRFTGYPYEVKPEFDNLIFADELSLDPADRTDLGSVAGQQHVGANRNRQVAFVHTYITPVEIFGVWSAIYTSTSHESAGITFQWNDTSEGTVRCDNACVLHQAQNGGQHWADCNTTVIRDMPASITTFLNNNSTTTFNKFSGVTVTLPSINQMNAVARTAVMGAEEEPGYDRVFLGWRTFNLSGTAFNANPPLVASRFTGIRREQIDNSGVDADDFVFRRENADVAYQSRSINLNSTYEFNSFGNEIIVGLWSQPHEPNMRGTLSVGWYIGSSSCNVWEVIPNGELSNFDVGLDSTGSAHFGIREHYLITVSPGGTTILPSINQMNFASEEDGITSMRFQGWRNNCPTLAGWTANLFFADGDEEEATMARQMNPANHARPIRFHVASSQTSIIGLWD
jgi:hypothetical protein